MKTPQEYYAIARSMFLSAHPDFQAALDDLKQEDADAMNMSLPQYRSMQADRLTPRFCAPETRMRFCFPSNWRSRIKK